MPKADNKLDMELIYNIARELGFSGDDFDRMVKELSKGVDLDAWCATVEDNIDDPDKVEAFYNMLDRDYEKSYTITIDLASAEDIEYIHSRLEKTLSEVSSRFYMSIDC